MHLLVCLTAVQRRNCTNVCSLSSFYMSPVQVSHDEHLRHISLRRLESSYSETDSTAASTRTSAQWICIGQMAVNLLYNATELVQYYPGISLTKMSTHQLIHLILLHLPRNAAHVQENIYKWSFKLHRHTHVSGVPSVYHYSVSICLSLFSITNMCSSLSLLVISTLSQTFSHSCNLFLTFIFSPSVVYT